MRFSAIFIVASAVLAAPFVSAQTVQTAGGATPQPVSAASATGTASTAKTTASTSGRRDIVSYVEELAGNTAAQLRSVQDENAELETRMIKLERKVAALQESNQKLLNEVAAVKRQSAADADAREAQMKAILSKLDKLAAAPPHVATVPAPVAAADDYEIYEVQKGATLSVIAKAYTEAFGKTVTVQDIKKANNLKSDMLQVGQKLKIPRK